ncbi:MAG: DUF1446 domain-containing protein [Pirellulaceae bacterium]|jgi:hypothetical protein|nr:DUF1446 domain-containing protein [Pirellulaceae bacterium]MDP7019339.1 DUF1446 domain-containing protein [Pirellulaceae bacterium]
MTIRVANGAGFLGDDLDAPRRLVAGGEVDYLTIEHLAELTLSILAYQRGKHPDRGYARDFLAILESLIPHCQDQPELRILTNSGGVNPLACARQAATLFCAAGLGDLRIGVVTGDDLLDRIAELQAGGIDLANMDTGEPLGDRAGELVSANVYLGAAPLVEALAADAQCVITGRIADASLTVAPAVHEFDWEWSDLDRLAGATVAGHLIECGAQVTGGFSSLPTEDLADVGYPIAELDPSGDCVITKPAETGGRVDRRSVAEQLIYEIGDPRCYPTPDVSVDFTSVQLAAVGENRVQVAGAKGNPRPAQYKASLAYRDGFAAVGQLLVFGDDCRERATAVVEIIERRLLRAGCPLDRLSWELLGAGQAAGTSSTRTVAPTEGVLRIHARAQQRQPVERFVKEIAPLITSGPAGLAGYAAARSPVRPVFAYWPTLIPRDAVEPRARIETALAWRDRPANGDNP